MLKQQLRAITAAFRPSRPLIIKICLAVGLVPTLAGVLAGTYITIMELWAIGYMPFDPSGFQAIDALGELIGIGLVWGVALLGWWLLTRLARGYASAALWWAVIIAGTYLITAGLMPAVFKTTPAALAAICIATLYVAAFVALRRLHAAKTAKAQTA